MKRTQILFSKPMIDAILEGNKTMTRRIVKASEKGCTVGAYTTGDKVEPVNVQEDGDPWYDIPCPYGQIGDQLWVKESHYLFGHWKINGKTASGKRAYKFIADQSTGVLFEQPPQICYKKNQTGWVYRTSLFMPRWASRITLEITDVRVERLQGITEEDAKAEGINALGVNGKPSLPESEIMSGREVFSKLWDKINGKRASWKSNPLVWVITFKKI